MKISELFKPFISFKKFEQNKKGQLGASKHFLEIVKMAKSNNIEPIRLEFFFEAHAVPNATALRSDLEEIGYEVFKIWKAHGDDHYWVNGRTDSLYLNPADFHKWIDLMNELGYVNDCKFDGWGLLMVTDESE